MIMIKHSDAEERLSVTVFPQERQVPANILRWHLIFSEPVAVDRWMDGVRLLDEQGREIEHAFLDLPEGLWSADGRILTILMHPRRIKSGVGGKNDGVAIDVGRSYRLVVDLASFDLREPRIRLSHTHAFVAIAPEGRQLMSEDIEIDSPPAASTKPAIVRSRRPLDLLSVASSAIMVPGNDAGVRFSVTEAVGDRMFLLTPDRPWPAGKVTFRLSSDLEDITGQRIGSPFEREQRICTLIA
jgi:hypothetical protein